MKFRNTLIGATLLAAAVGSSALSLGRARGNATLGQPLDISFEVRLDSPDDSSAPCVNADILHGDNRIDASKTRISVEPGQGQDVLIRMRSSVVVDEPIVSVLLKVGCNQNTTRRYDFLADFPTEARATVPPMNASQAPSPTVVSAPPSPAAAEPPALPPPQRAVPAPAPVPARPPALTQSTAPAAVPPAAPPPAARPAQPRPRPAAVARAPAPVAAAPKAATPPAVKPRLKLEAVEITPQREAALKISPELKEAPAADNAAQRAEAAALWQAMNAQPQDVMAQAKKLEEAEAANKALREQTARNEARLTDLQTRLQKLEEERYANGVTYGLLALLIAVSALAVYLWLKRREAETMTPEWWRNREAMAEDQHSENLGVVSTGAASLLPSSAAGRLTKVDVDLNSVPGHVPGGAPAGAPPPKVSAKPNLAVPLAAPVAAGPTFIRTPHEVTMTQRPQRSVNPEELFDVQQHAEFFVSLGQYDQAIAVLRKHISENVESSPLAYLDLLKVYHTLSRIEDYNQLRGDFNRIFNGQVPPFAGFTNEGKTLEDYPHVMAEIQELWPSPQVQPLIEEYLYPHPDGQSEPFDLAAFRELLMLHAMGKTGVLEGEDNEEAAQRLAQVRRSRVTPLSASEFDRSAAEDFSHSELSSVSGVLSSQTIELYSPAGKPLSDLPAIASSDELGLDLDLSDDVPGGKLMPDVDISSVLPDDDLPQLEPLDPPPAEAKSSVRSNLVDFDLFDPDIEADLTPKPTRH